MNLNRPRSISRRRFIGFSFQAAVAAILPSAVVHASNPARKTILSFYCDDTGPYTAGAEAFGTFLDFCAENDIAGESSVILGANGRSMTRNPDEQERVYLRHVRRARECGVDAHMEIMTHRGRFDFSAGREPNEAQHEGVWLYEPETAVSEYERYFADIIADGERKGVRFTGLTWPGCSCEACTRRYAELRAAGHRSPNPNLWRALLNLARQGQFEGPTVPCFFDSSEAEFGAHLKAGYEEYGVYDLMPNAEDRFGIWDNDPAKVDPDYYITEDGKSGIIVRHVATGSPYCLFYAHWQGLNPKNGAGWPAFVKVIQRVQKHLGGKVAWMRPSEITDRYHAAGGWDFREPLAPGA